LIIIAWFIIAAVFVGVPSAYYLQMKKWSTKPWKLDINENYQPSTAILVPVHNEEKTIRLKLENLSKVKYPVEKIEIVIVNDASTDNTLTEINQYTAHNSSLKVNVFDSKEHIGKANCLNQALSSVNADVVIISDADCFWPSDILLKALPYLSDPNVGAITGRELLLNSKRSWVTAGEQLYDATVQSIRIGESKMHSTIFFQGGFAAYKYNFLRGFDHTADDSGTALNVVQRNKRTLLTPDAIFYTAFPVSWKSRIAIKTRRAKQLQQLWIDCLKLALQRKLILPKKIAMAEIFLHVLNPVVFLALMLTTVVLIITQPLYPLIILSVFVVTLAIPKIRMPLIEVIQNNLILLASLFSLSVKKNIKVWKTSEESRSLVDEEILRAKQLI
jgi:cellulose synthase/poly-beta-1,6-N-acetylglucosamine synthase-like glycosyltransferase